jgi:hypothetical protein
LDGWVFDHSAANIQPDLFNNLGITVAGKGLCIRIGVADDKTCDLDRARICNQLPVGSAIAIRSTVSRGSHFNNTDIIDGAVTKSADGIIAQGCIAIAVKPIPETIARRVNVNRIDVGMPSG